ncbi:MAG TPA: hypothetical protein ENJ56_01130 [Anaerolineae bacterium]|nr:hypothetical protein [Anaerolineae bacterium]
MQPFPTTTPIIPPHVLMFADTLDDGLVAMARFGDNLPGHPNAPQAKMNYLALVQSETPLADLRTAFGQGFGTLPLVLDDDVYSFAAQIEPVTINRLQQGEWWGKHPILQQLDVSLAVQVSSLAFRLLNTSLLLASHELSESERVSAETERHDLALLFEIDHTLPVPLQLATCFATLEAIIDAEPTKSVTNLQAKALDTDGCLSGLQAIYSEIDSAIFVIESGETLADVDWACLQAKYGADFGRIQFTTSKLLPLLAQHDMAVAFAIERFRLAHGNDLLADIKATPEQLIINAAQTVMRLYSAELPHGYINADNEQMLGVHIHDLQNQFLKVQFQYEILTMLHDIPQLPAPRLHIDRALSREARMVCLRQHLREWLSLYEQLLKMVRAEL